MLKKIIFGGPHFSKGGGGVTKSVPLVHLFLIFFFHSLTKYVHSTILGCLTYPKKNLLPLVPTRCVGGGHELFGNFQDFLYLFSEFSPEKTQVNFRMCVFLFYITCNWS